MARLYELFVAEWLKAHQTSGLLPHNLAVKSQHLVHITQDRSLAFNIDLVLFDIATGQTRYVLDTKYKTPTPPETTRYKSAKYPSSYLDVRRGWKLGTRRNAFPTAGIELRDGGFFPGTSTAAVEGNTAP
jgi:hypothetical protein